MKPNPTLRSSRLIPAFTRFFPHRLRYHSLSRKLGFPVLSNQSRPFSVRSARARPSSDEIRASKSLIDDEADLSDWVSGLSSNSFRNTSLYSSDDEKDKHVGGGRGGRGSSERFGGRDRAVKRQRESDSDDYGSNRQTGRRSMGSNPRDSSARERFGGNRMETGRKGFREGGVRERFDGNKVENGQKSFRGGGDRNMGIRESKGYDMENKHKNTRDSYSRGRERFSNGGGELRRGGKSLSRGRFATSSDEEFGDDSEEEERGKMKSFSELISEDSEDEDDEDEDGDDGEEEELRGAETLFPSRKETTPRVAPSSIGSSDSYLSATRFDQCSISSLSLKGIKDAGYEKMTVVQEATLPIILKGKDVLAKAKTGTGKTVAFLLPSIEVVAKIPPASRDSKRPPILVLVICPTRELATQAANEANTLLKYHPSIGVQVVIGGTRLALEQKRMQANPCQILVATPGRLRDHVENTAGFATRLMGVKVLVLDEADHLLDMGFRKDIEKIIAAVPKQRQTLLFSATVPQEVRQICHIALRRDHEFVDTVGEDTEQTHAQVSQMHLIAPLDKQFSLLYAMLRDHIADDVDYKVLVFCTTAMVTRLVADLLGELNLNVREIHSRKPQSYRTRVSDEFRKSKGLILVTSDVSARGVDYPDVTLVIQVGLPSDREQYIHRLGRTGRKGKEGQGILMLAPWEKFFLSSLKDLPISEAPLPLVDPETKKKVERALSHVEMKNKEAAYQAWLGFYNSNKTISRDKTKLVELANEFSRSMGLDDPPAIPKLVLGKMGLKNVPGLRSK